MDNITEKYDYIGEFNQGIAIVVKNNLYGAILAGGHEIIAPAYDYISPFKDGYTKAFLKGQFKILNLVGQECKIYKDKLIVIPTKYDTVRDFKNGYACVEVNKKWGVIDTDCNEIFEPQFDYISDFIGGTAKFKENRRYANSWGYVNADGYRSEANLEEPEIEPDGNLIISRNLPSIHINRKLLQYGSSIKVRVNNNGKLVVKNGNTFITIDKDFLLASDFSNGLSCVKDSAGYSGYVDTRGRVVVPIEYCSLQIFSEGRTFGVNKNGKLCLISSTGCIIKELVQYETAYPFIHGYAIVYSDGKYGLINTEGDEVLAPIVGNLQHKDTAHEFLITLDGKEGYFNAKTKRLIRPRYKKILEVSREHATVEVPEIGCVFVDWEGRTFIKENGRIYLPDWCIGAKKILDNVYLGLSDSGKWGLLNQNGETLCMPSFDSIGEINGDIIQTEVHYTIKRGGYWNQTEELVSKYGLYNLVTKVCIPAQYDKHPEYKDEYYLVQENGLYGAIDLNGNQILKPEWIKIERSSDYYIVEREIEKPHYVEILKGLADSLGNIILNTEFEEIEILKNGLYKAGAIYEWYIYNDKGRLTEESYEEVSYDGNIINVTSEGWQGCLDESGKKFILSEDGKYIELPSKFSWGRDFKNGTAEVLINGCENLVDKEFNLVLKNNDIIIPIDKSIEYIAERDDAGNCIFVRGNKYGLLSPEGEIVIDAKYHRLSVLSIGFYIAAIKDENIYCNALGIIDVNENIILKFEYSTIEPFKGKIPRSYWTWDDKFVTEYVDMPDRIDHWLIHKNKYGLIDLNGKVCIEPEYEDILKFEHGFFLKKDNKYMVVDSKYSRVNEKNYDTITSIGNDLWKVVLTTRNGSKLYGILDSHGKERLEPVYTSIGDINENNVAIITRFESYGLIDENYNIIADPIYEHISNFEGGKAKARKYDKTEGTIDTKGVFTVNITETKNDNTISKVKTLKNGLIVVKNQTNQLCAIVDSEENIILPYQYKHIDELENGMYKVSSGSQYSGKFGLLDKDFNEIVEPIYAFLEPLGNAFIVSAYESFWRKDIGLLNSRGRITLPLIYSSIKLAWGDMVWIYTNNNELIGLATINGDILIEPCFGKVEPISNGYAKVNAGRWYNEEDEYSNSVNRKYSEGAWGVIDTSGRLVVPTAYHSVKIENDGTFSVFGNYGYGRLNKDTKLVIKGPEGHYIPADSRFDWQHDFDSNGRSIVYSKDKYGSCRTGCINSQGQFIVSSTPKESEDYHIIPDGFEWAYYCSEETFIGEKNGKKGVYRYDCTEIIPSEYDHIKCEDDIYIVRKDYQASVLSGTGEVILPLTFSSIEVITDPYSNIKYYKCNICGKFGLYSLDGSELIPVNYKQLTILHHNLLSVKDTDGKFWVYNNKGTCVNNEYFDTIADFGKSLKKNSFPLYCPKEIENPLYAIVQKNGLFGAINSLGATVIPPKYEELYCVNRNIFCANGTNIDYRGQKVVYSEGKIVRLPDEYSSGELLENGLVLVEKYGRYGCINQIGEIIIPTEYTSLRFSGNLIVASRRPDESDIYLEELGVINILNEVVVQFSKKYEEIIISENSILYKEDDKWGAYTLEGRMICGADYDHIAALSDNLLKVGMNGTAYAEYNDYYWEDGERYDFTNYSEYSIINWGVIDFSAKEILPICYSEIYSLDDNFIRIQEGKRIGYADITGKILIEPVYVSIGDFVDGYAIVSKTSSYDDEDGHEREKSIYGVIDSSFKEIIPCIFEYLEYDTNLGLFETNIGYKSTDGRYVTDANGKTILVDKKYKYCKPFQDNCAIAVMCKNYEVRYGLIDTMSNDIIPPLFEKLELVDNGLYKFRINELYGLINSNGDIVLANQYDYISKFSEGYGSFSKVTSVDSKGDKTFIHGLIDRQGNEILPASYSFIGNVSEGKAVLMNNNIWQLFDVNTRNILQFPDISYLGICKEGLCRYNMGGSFDLKNLKTKGGRWGYLDQKGEIIINPTYEIAHAFSEGKAAVKQNGKWGFINTKGDIIVPCEYDKFESAYSKGYGKLIKNNKVFIFDENGKAVNTDI